MEIRTKQLMDHHVRSLDKPVWLKFQLRQLFNVAYTETYFQNEGSKLKKNTTILCKKNDEIFLN